MSAKSVVSAFTGFLGKHIVDLNSIADVLGELTSIVPIDSQDKERINTVIDTVRNSANNINDFLEGNKVQGGEVTVKESDIVEALANFFKSPEGEAAIKNVLTLQSAEGNGNA